MANGNATGDMTTLLEGLIALDLTSGHTHLAGSTLAHMGMRVLHPTTALGEGTDDPVDWFESSGKELFVADGPEAILQLLPGVDVVLLDSQSERAWGVTADAATAASPGAAVTLITPYGAAGPRAHDADSEMTLQAAGGQMWMAGYDDRPPVALAGNQAYYHAATQAVAGVLGALIGKLRHGGGGELVDVSAQEALCNALVQSKGWWYVAKKNLQRSFYSALGGQALVRMIWPAADGYVAFRVQLGVGDASRRMDALVEWVISEGGFGEELRDVKWGKTATTEVKTEDLRRWEEPIARFFAMKTRAELFAGARQRDLLLLPVLTPAEILVDEHSVARESFARAEGRDFSVPGFPVRVKGRPGGRIPPRVVAPPTLAAHSADAAAKLIATAPLAGINVLDFGWAVAGPTTSRMLGLLGATVIKIESNTRIDATRASAPFVGRPSRDRSGYFSTHNGSKLGMVLDLNHPKSRGIMERLVRWADVAAENFSAGRMEEWDLGYDTMSKWNPRLVMLRSSSWGQDGPYRQIPANGIILGSFCGFGALMGWPDRAPVGSVEPYTDMISPWFASSAILAALIRRERTGQGLELDVSQVDCSYNFLGPEYIAASMGNEPMRTGPFRCDPYPRGVFRAAGTEEWVVVEVENEAHWRGLCAVTPGLEGSGEMTAERVAAMAPLVFTSIAGYFAGAPAELAARRLQVAGVPAAKVQKSEDLYNDPQLAFRNHFVELPHPSMGHFAYEMPYFRYRTRGIAVTRSPLIGEHNGEVLGDFLGYTADEIADLYAEGVLN